VELLRDAVALRSDGAPGLDPGLSYTRLSLAQALDENGDAAGAEAVLRARISGLTTPDTTDRSRKGLQDRVQQAMARTDLAWFLIDHARAADAQEVARQALQAVPAKVTTSWIHPHQKTLEALVWAQLLSPATPALAAQWTAYDDAVRGNIAGSRKMLFQETDRALVAQALQDAGMQAAARSGVQEALSKSPQRPAMLCQALLPGSRTNWHRLQQEGRRRMLTELGGCAPA
jgi:hypothetical protein